MSMSPKRLISAAALSIVPLLAVATPAPGWQVVKPYQDNLTKTAVLAGTAQYDGVKGPATLTVVCRPDAGKPYATLQIDKTVADRFPVRSFEGPPGIGRNARLLGVELEKEALRRSFYSNGAYQENNVFEWTFNPQKAEFMRWIKATGKTMKVYVVKPAKKEIQLQATFQLPASNQPLSDVAMPCLKK